MPRSNRVFTGPVLSLLLAGMASLATSPSSGQRWDPEEARTPPIQVSYAAMVFSAESGEPIPGIQIRAHENHRRYRCSSGDNDGNCGNCSLDYDQMTRLTTTNATGLATTAFSFLQCYYEPGNPMWVSTVHESFSTPELVGADGAEEEWVVAYIENGQGEVDHNLYLTKEQDLAEHFSPVLHAHRGRELQNDLADLVETVDEHSTICAYDATGRRIHGPSSPPPLHIVGNGLNSYGASSTPEFWQLDIDNDWVREGAAPGERPLYYHLFPHSDGIVLQYWLWFNGNDLRDLPGVESRHEGDWEYAALYLECHDGEWQPQKANLSQHQGGHSLLTDELWWSASSSDDYEGLAQGYDADRTHPHFWLAANSHSLYSRFAPVYELDVDLEPICNPNFTDRVDYNPGDNPAGDHRYFRFDRVENMGEFWIDEDPAEGFWQWEGGPLEYLCFVGRFGDSYCVDPPACPGTCDFPVYLQMAYAPFSPLYNEEPHMWQGFQYDLGRWGNNAGSPTTIRWIQPAPIGNYLGLYETCAEGFADTVRTYLYNDAPDGPAIAQFTVVSGDIVVHDADAEGRIWMEREADNSFLLETAQVSGEGELRIDVFSEADPDFEIATDLRVEIIPHADCDGTASARPAARMDARGLRAFCALSRVQPNPAEGPLSLQFQSPSPPFVHGWEIHDSAGRRVFFERLAVGTQSSDWNGILKGGKSVSTGVYFVSLVGPGGRRESVGRISIVR